jgi:hypothetical protein
MASKQRVGVAAREPRKSSSANISTYKLYVKVISAAGLSGGGRIDPSVVLQLEGSKVQVQTQADSNTTSPTWDEVLELEGGYAGSDVLKITVQDKKTPLGMAELPIRDIPLGQPTDKSIGLLKVDPKGRVDKRSKPGSAGQLQLQLSAQKPGNGAFANAPWDWPLYDVSIGFVSVDDAVNTGKAVVERFMVVKLSPSLNEQRTRTKGHTGSPLSPSWGGEKKDFLVGDCNSEFFDLTLWEKDPAAKDPEKLGRATLSLRDIPVGEPVDIPIDLQNEKTRDVVGRLNLKLELVDKGAVPEKVEPVTLVKPGRESALTTDVAAKPVAVHVDAGECGFVWDSYSSSYSTNFTGYTGYGQSLSDLQASEEAEHQHAVVAEVAEVKRRIRYALNGTVVRAAGLPRVDVDGTDFYVVVDIAGKWKPKKKDVKSRVVHGTSNPQWNLAFDFGQVTKGIALEFAVWQTHKVLGDVPIAVAKKVVKDIDIEARQPLEIPLGKPARRCPRLLRKNGAWGSLFVSFNITTAVVQDVD